MPRSDPVAVQVWQEGAGSAALCLVHPLGGDVQPYRQLVSALDDRLTVCLIADPALGGPELPAWPIAERARRYREAVAARLGAGERRWQLGGWSFGAWVAVAMASEAEAAGRPADAVCLIDPPSPDAGPWLAAYDDSQLDTVFASELAAGGWEDRATPLARSYAARLARCGRANLASMTGYQPPVLAVTPAQLWLAGRPEGGRPAGQPAPDEPEARVRQWRSRLPRLVAWHALDATHDGIVRQPHVQVIAAAISSTAFPAPPVG